MTNENPYIQIGQKLSTQRSDKKITVSELAQKLKISADYIKKIEQGEFDFLPDVYIRAFLKTYAEHVGLNPDSIINEYNALKKPPLPDETEPNKSDVKIIKPKSEYSVKQNRPKWLFYALGTLLAVILIFSLMNKKDSVPQPPVNITIEKDSTQVVDTPETPERQPEKNPELVLEILATDTTWLQITHYDSLVDEAIFYPGDYKRWKSDTPFTLKIGNAGGAEMTLNGTKLGSPGKKGQIKKVKISENGFTAITAKN